MDGGHCANPKEFLPKIQSVVAMFLKDSKLWGQLRAKAIF
jgi:hypothetical protein